MKFKDYYQIMGIERDATQDDIKRAYRKLARKYHPDVSKETQAEERFKEVGEAYEVLKDPEKRAAYDQLGSNWQQGEEFRPPPGWQDGFEFSGGGFTGADSAHFSDFFEDLFGRSSAFGSRGGRQQGFQMKGEDHHAKVAVSLEDTFHGAERSIMLKTPEVDNSGHVITRERTLSIKIPKGVTQGQRIRLKGQGGAAMGNADAGDLFLEIDLIPHPLFKAEGRDIYIDLPIAPWEAALGAQISVPTLGGKVDMKIPAGSQTGKKLRLKGRGIPGKQPGDQYVILKIVVPDATTDAQKELYRQMEKEMKFNPRSRMEV